MKIALAVLLLAFATAMVVTGLLCVYYIFLASGMPGWLVIAGAAASFTRVLLPVGIVIGLAAMVMALFTWGWPYVLGLIATGPLTALSFASGMMILTGGKTSPKQNIS